MPANLTCPNPFLSKVGNELSPFVITAITIFASVCILVLAAGSEVYDAFIAVSYTHLTLPTIYSV